MAAARTHASCKLARAALARFAPAPAMASPCASLLPAPFVNPAAATPAAGPHGALLGQVRQLSLGAWRGPLAAEAAAVGFPSQRTIGAARGFRSSLAAAASADSGLAEALQAEIKHEAETYEAPEEAGKGPPAPFTVEMTPGAAELVLRRSFEGEDIAVIVSSPEEDSEDDLDFGDDDDAEEAEEPQEGQEDVGEEGLEPFLPVRVNITKKAADGTLQVMEVDCGVEGDECEWVIEGVRLESPDVPEDSIAYSGPDYYTLDPSLQEQFDAYLERRGFTKELGRFIRSCLTDKEQQEYVAWLGRVAKFVS